MLDIHHSSFLIQHSQWPRSSAEPNTLVAVTGGTVELVWTLGGGSTALVLGSSEYDSPARRFVRGALPYFFGVLALAGVLAVAAGSLDA